ncbi:hypothetical protein ANCDUO_11985, partial [Ancylostoma duodenale]
MYAKIESERLLYIRLNQRKLRVDDYIHLRDAIANDGNSTDVGRLVILPATFTVEWQKRGLPHAHVLIWLKDKIHPTQIDTIISAEIPNPEQDPGLFEIITKNMIHGPCGPLNPNSPCMKDRKCSKRYPREFIQETQTGNDGYPLYRRRKPGEGGFAAVVKIRMNNQQTEVEVDNSVHLENGQRVYFTADTGRERAANPPNTTLTAFFQLCQQDSFARTLLYPEVPRYYTWNASRKVFCKRKQGAPVPGRDVRESDALGRVYTVHPNNDECYFLWLLIHTVRGPTSFADLKTVDGEVCETYREACQRRGLLENDQHWDTTLAEACLTCFPSQLRSLFAIIVTSCAPSNPQSLWEKYKESLSEDILRENRRINPEVSFCTEVFNQALILLEDKCISISSKTLSELGLHAPSRSGAELVQSEVLRERNYDIEELNEIAVAIVSSGIAATLLDGGRTAHSALKLPLNLARSENPVCNISKGSGKAQVLKTCKVIVWDECTMAHKRALEALDRTLQDIRENNRLVGGAVLVLAGDFRQTLPVIPRATPADELNACLKASYLWRHVQKMTLTTNMRVHLQGDLSAQSFAQQLLRLGDGEFPVDPDTDLISFPSDFCHIADSPEELIVMVFPDISNNFRNHQWLRDRAILAPMNDSVNKINTEIQNQLPGPAVTYASVDTVVDSEQA